MLVKKTRKTRKKNNFKLLSTGYHSKTVNGKNVLVMSGSKWTCWLCLGY